MRIEFNLRVGDSIPLFELTSFFENAVNNDISAQIVDVFGCDNLICQALGEEDNLTNFLENYGMTLDYVEKF